MEDWDKQTNKQKKNSLRVTLGICNLQDFLFIAALTLFKILNMPKIAKERSHLKKNREKLK